jgi:hypothetical protein
MPIVLPPLPEPSPGETGPYVVIARHRALPGRTDAYEQRMLADLGQTRAEPEHCSSTSTETGSIHRYS